MNLLQLVSLQSMIVLAAHHTAALSMHPQIAKLHLIKTVWSAHQYGLSM